ncbi:MAG: hypothetical protein JJ992_04220, partial [Planctomycetes bacterium]|nr:hypothetical protein [Planctomycetota bacterium]
FGLKVRLNDTFRRRPRRIAAQDTPRLPLSESRPSVLGASTISRREVGVTEQSRPATYFRSVAPFS